MKTLKKGDSCKIRLKSGNVIEAVYDVPSNYLEKHHWVLVDGFSKLIGHSAPITDGRFIGPSCQMGV